MTRNPAGTPPRPNVPHWVTNPQGPTGNPTPAACDWAAGTRAAGTAVAGSPPRNPSTRQSGCRIRVEHPSNRSTGRVEHPSNRSIGRGGCHRHRSTGWCVGRSGEESVAVRGWEADWSCPCRSRVAAGCAGVPRRNCGRACVGEFGERDWADAVQRARRRSVPAASAGHPAWSGHPAGTRHPAGPGNGPGHAGAGNRARAGDSSWRRDAGDRAWAGDGWDAGLGRSASGTAGARARHAVRRSGQDHLNRREMAGTAIWCVGPLRRLGSVSLTEGEWSDTLHAFV